MYVELLIVFNSCYNILLVIVCSRLLDEPIYWKRMLIFCTLSSCIGALLSATIWTTLLAFIVIQLAFSSGQRLKKLTLLLIISFVLGGMLTGLQTYATTKIEYFFGVIISVMLFLSLFIAFVKRLYVQQLMKRYERPCMLQVLNEQFHCAAFIDTGNQSIEPISGHAIHYATLQILAPYQMLQQAFLSWDANKPYDLSMFPKEVRRLLHPVQITTIEQQSLVLACSCSLHVEQQQFAQQFVVFIQEPLQFPTKVQVILNASVLTKIKGDRYCFEA